MSALSAIGSSSQSFMAQATQQKRSPADIARMMSSADYKNDFATAAAKAGADPSQIDSLFAQVQTAAASAPKNSNGTVSRNNMQEAIDKVLQSNGVDLEKFREVMNTLRQSHHKNVSGQNGADPRAQTNPAEDEAKLDVLA